MIQSTGSTTTSSTPDLHECEILDAGYVQRREWTCYKIREDHYPFNTTINFLLESFDPVPFQKTINAMVERHEILRTTLRVIDGTLKQVIYPAKNFIVGYKYYDISDKDADQQKDLIENKTGASIQTPFNFEFGPMFRVQVFKKSNNQHIVYFTVHHVIFDLHSFQVFRDDIARLWKMNSNNFFQPLVSKTTQYKDYTEYENELLFTEKGKPHEKYWENRLSEGIPRLEIIDEDKWNLHQERYAQLVEELRGRMRQLDFNDEAVMAGVLRKYKPTDGGFYLYRYNENIYQGIKRYEQSGNNGLLALWIASISLTFYEFSGQRRFAFDTPGLSRAQRFKETIGWLTTGGPCFVNVPEGEQPKEFLDHVDKELFQLSRHCIYPFETIGSRYHLPLGGSMPIFFTMVTKEENIPVQNFGTLGKASKGCDTFQDIALFFYLFKDAVSVSVGYDNLVFDEPFIESFLQKHELILGKILNEL